MSNRDISDVIVESSLKLIFANAILNTLLHGLSRKNYRKGFHYLAQTLAHVISCGIFRKPSGYQTLLSNAEEASRDYNVIKCILYDMVFYESKKKMRNQHQKAAEMNRNMKALQAIQKTLYQTKRRSRPSNSWSGEAALAATTPASIADRSGYRGSAEPLTSEFFPSKRLQELFDQCLQDSADSDESDTSSDIDYDALVFAEQVKIYDELKTVWCQVRK